MQLHSAHYVIVPALLALSIGLSATAAHAQTAAIPRILPPVGIEIPADDLARLKSGVAALTERVASANTSLPANLKRLLPDVEVYLKAVRYAIENGEFFDPKDIGRADDLLKQANARLDELLAGKHSWTTARGLVVRGYRSTLDDSVQPYGLVIPKDLDLAKSPPVPLYVWLHGRGDKVCDLQFIHQRQTNSGQISPANAIVLHPFGRYCNAFKFAGEVDVIEAKQAAEQSYPVDPDRVGLWGFSMGGAGAWHLGAHFPDWWAAVSPGAGFAETARYQRLDPAAIPSYERTLWGWYDAPNYVRNLFNVPVLAYSGELDKQIQAARVMEEAFQKEGRTLTHLIGPGVEHKYEPQTLARLAELVAAEAAKGRPKVPKQVTLQTRSLRYGRCHWVGIHRMENQWQEARVDAELADRSVEMKTSNVAELLLGVPAPDRSLPELTKIVIDGQTLAAKSLTGVKNLWLLEKQNGRWQTLDEPRSYAWPGVKSAPNLAGPIDDAFLRRFLVVAPSGKSSHAKVDAWVRAELAHFQDRWRRLFRGDVRIKRDTDVTEADIAENNLILWGDAASNRLVARVLEKLPIRWSRDAVTVGDQSFDAASHVPALVYPSPVQAAGADRRYIVLNSGFTFREGHDRSNSLQTPKLPDWAVVDLSQPADQLAPGKIAAAGFFDDRWQLAGSER